MTVKEEDIEVYNGLLSNFQSDILYFVSSIRRNGHFLSAEEIRAEVNYRLIKYRDTSIKNNRGSLTKNGFRKLFCGTCKNVVRWTCQGVKPRDVKYFKNKRANNIVNENGDTFFEFICSIRGEPDENFFEFEKCDRIKNIKIWIEEYSDFLTERELLVFKGMAKGLGVNKLGEELGVTHQAVTCLWQTLQEKIKSNIKTELNSDSDVNIIKKATHSINRLFDS